MRIAAAAATGTLTVLLASGCSFSIGNAEKKSETTASEDAAAEESPAEEKPAGDDPEAPGDAGTSEDGAVHKARVAQAVSDKLTATTGQRPDKVTCPENLPARVGATIRCELTAGSDTLGVTVTTTAVNGKEVDFDIKVDDNVG
ncbi:DUF4333 domain-containing protein [Streptomyces althioticus]|jgi:hypothetical protein|uniref:DUF4333 domain-containing protein n=1 Tax=Streptomyces althioticus group TaxID=2867194 RepID=UPI00177F311B|nr:DUF4333 domain-containing protein [Streptomyces althioticus]WTB94218.1 DUF4333 domain-containing protein [Streptomyces althioticus]GGQ83419.1 hypothetical protein GCM10010267_52830 [Streptomyces griseorubens]